jgi:hypothetical protein
MAEYPCPCGCGLRLSVTRACCVRAWNRLPPKLQRQLTSTTGLQVANPAARRRAFAAIADWLRDNPEVGRG